MTIVNSLTKLQLTSISLPSMSLESLNKIRRILRYVQVYTSVNEGHVNKAIITMLSSTVDGLSTSSPSRQFDNYLN